MAHRVIDQSYDSIVLASGGIDSTVVIAWLVAGGSKPLNLFVRQGEQETDLIQEDLAHKLADHYGCPFYSIHAEQLFKGFWTSGLFAEREERKDKYIPGYRMMLYMLALQVADWGELTNIYMGGLQSIYKKNGGDADPDEKAFKSFIGKEDVRESSLPLRMELTKLYGKMYRAGNDGAFNISDPFTGWTKLNLMKLGQKLDVPYEKTVTCRSPEINFDSAPIVHCGRGTCYFCNQRRECFRLAGISDPTAYLHDEPVGNVVDLALLKD